MATDQIQNEAKSIKDMTNIERSAHEANARALKQRAETHKELGQGFVLPEEQSAAQPERPIEFTLRQFRTAVRRDAEVSIRVTPGVDRLRAIDHKNTLAFVNTLKEEFQEASSEPPTEKEIRDNAHIYIIQLSGLKQALGGALQTFKRARESDSEAANAVREVQNIAQAKIDALHKKLPQDDGKEYNPLLPKRAAKVVAVGTAAAVTAGAVIHVKSQSPQEAKGVEYNLNLADLTKAWAAGGQISPNRPNYNIGGDPSRDRQTSRAENLAKAIDLSKMIDFGGQEGTAEGQEVPVLAIPSAVLTDKEKENVKATFPAVTQPQFAGIFEASGGKVNGLPFEKNSEAFKRVEALEGLLAETAKRGGEPDLISGFANGEMSPVIKINKPITVKLSDGREKTYKAGTHMFMTQGGALGYLEPTGRPGWRVKLFQADEKFEQDVTKFLFKGKPLKVTRGEWVLAEVDQNKNTKVILIAGLALNLYDTADPSLPKATPQPGSSSDLPTPEMEDLRPKMVDSGYKLIQSDELEKIGFTSGVELEMNGQPVKIVSNVPGLNIEGIDKSIFEKNLQSLGIVIYNENIIELRDMKDYKPSMKGITYEKWVDKNNKPLEIVVKPTRNTDNTKTVHRVYISQDILKNFNWSMPDGRYRLDLYASTAVLDSVLVSITMNGSVLQKSAAAITENSHFMKVSYSANR